MNRRKFLKMIGAIPIAVIVAKTATAKPKDFDNTPVKVKPRNPENLVTQNTNLDMWGGLTGICRNPHETDYDLRNRIVTKLKAPIHEQKT